MLLTIAFFGLLFAGVPVAFVLLATALLFAVDAGRLSVIGAFPSQIYSSLELFDLLAIPLFILLGEIMSGGGLTGMLFGAAARMLRRLPRSLAFVTLVSNLFLAALLGSANAQVAVMSRVVLPEMDREGYSREFSAALTAGASLLGPIVPPSMVFIIYAVVARVSISDMFLAGIVPGLLLFLAMALIILFSKPFHGRARPATTAGHASRAGGGKLLPVLGALAVPMIIVGSILGGVATPTESAGIAVIVALVVTWTLFKPIPAREIYAMLVRTAMHSTIVLFLIATARVFGFILTYYHLPQAASEFMVAISAGPISFMLLVVLLLLLIGALMEGMAAIIILVPILLPTATGVFGIDPVAFGIVFCITLIIGLLTPPVGTVLYISAAMSKVSIGRLSKALLPYILASLAIVLLVVFFPGIVIWRG